MANSIFLSNGGLSTDAAGNATAPGSVTAGSAATGSFYAADGTSGLPSYSFTSEPTLGFYRSSAANVTLAGSLTASGLTSSGQVNMASSFRSSGTGTNITMPANGQMAFNNNGASAGVGLDFATDGTIKFLTRAMADTAIVNASRFSSGANLGVVTFGPAAVVSITVKGGLVTAIS